MKTIEIIKAKSGKKYLSEVINELPTNCLFDKGAVGCGGTTLAINSKLDYVICVPFVSLIDNKVAQHKNIFAVKEGVSINMIKDYLQAADNIKIMVTYDSLYKVVEALGTKVNTVNLLIDELHLLFTQYSFRKSAIKSVLDLYTKFKTFCFMTATPVKEKYTLKELKGIKTVKCEWSDVIETSVKSVKCENVEGTVCSMINQFLNAKDTDENLYFFVNSIAFINKVVEYCGLTDDNARMICSKSNAKDEKKKLLLKITDTVNNQDTIKKINFITSTAFEGTDLYDENGKIFIVSDALKANTLEDISTSLPQIAGRIRNSKYNGSIFHLYSQTRYTDVTVEENEARTQQGIKEANITVEGWDKLDEIAYNNIKEAGSIYLFKNENNRWYFDENAVLIDMWNFEICNGIYSFRNRLNDEYAAKGFNVVELNDYTDKLQTIAKAATDSELSFGEIVKIIKTETENKPDFNLYLETLKEIAFKKYPFLKNAIDTLGFGQLGTLKYNQRAIKAAMINKEQSSESVKVIKVAKLLGLSSGDFITNADIKAKLSTIYKALGINKTAKAGDIVDYFEVKKSQRRIDGKQTDGYSIIRCKVVIK